MEQFLLMMSCSRNLPGINSKMTELLGFKNINAIHNQKQWSLAVKILKGVQCVDK